MNFLCQALEYLVKISEVDETEIFKICLEYWNSLSAELYRENPFLAVPLPSNSDSMVPTRRQIYLPILTKVSLPRNRKRLHCVLGSSLIQQS